ncbi:MAG: monovalent cation/H+ antiporter subunit D family protein [Acidobacteria bacterium]|jgi:multicomponent Na+:H+ antiporter subunit D|nr:monovalent cation/H+ antiporter subunit D family protein [Acidobacteriota bacterium]
MTTYTSLVPLLAVLVSLAAVPLILLSSKHRNLREFWTIAAAVIKFGLVLSLLPRALANITAQIGIIEIFPGIEMMLRADPFGVFFALIASGLWIFTSFYSIGYVRGVPEHKQTRYFASFAVCVSATIGIAFSANLLTFVIFYEILTIATYPLVIHKETGEAIKGGRKYLIYTLTAGLFLIAASIWTYQLTGTLDFKAGGLFTEGILTPQTAVVLFFLFLMGVGVKASIMPLHSWLPTAMVAPTPVSALLHAVAVVKSGVFAVIRVVGFVFGPVIMSKFGLNNILVFLACFTIIVASLIALRQENLKRRLAFSTVAHLSYVVLGAALLTPSSFTGGIMHIAFHATMKITLFFVAGAIYVNLHRENISQLDGIGKVMPWTMGAFTVGAIGLAGIPPVNGFISKWYLGVGAVESGNLVPLVILVISGLLNVAYLFPIAHAAFFKKGKNLEGHGEAPLTMVIPLVLTALLSLLFGLFPNLFFKLFQLAGNVAASIMGGGV